MTEQSPPPPIGAKMAAIVLVMVDFEPLNGTKGLLSGQTIAANKLNGSFSFEVTLDVLFNAIRLWKRVPDRCSVLINKLQKVREIFSSYVHEVNFYVPLHSTILKGAFVPKPRLDTSDIVNCLFWSYVDEIKAVSQAEPKRHRIGGFMP
jgi:hypothetical protein